MTDERPRLEINWVQSMAGSLAAVSSAVLLSTFGVAGTLIGAAVGSLVITIGGAVYSYSIRATRERVAMAQTVASARIGLAQARVREASQGAAAGTRAAREHVAEDLTEAEVDLERAQDVLEDAADEDRQERLDWREVLAGLPWRRITVVTTTIFVVAMLAILAFELITGRAVSTYTGGTDSDRRTSIPGLGGGSEPAPAEQPGTDQPATPQEAPPTEQPGEVLPTEEPTQAPTSEPAPTPPAPTEPGPEPEPVPIEPAPSP